MKKYTIILSVIILSGLFYLPGCNILNDDNPDTPQQKAGDTLWIHTVPKGAQNLWIPEQPLAIGKDGSVYYTASGGTANWEPSRVYAVNKDDGTIKWISEPLELWHVNSNIVVGDDGTVYVMSYTKLYSINPGSGSFNWIWEVPQTLTYEGNDVYTYGEVSSLALSDNGDLIFKTSGSGVYWRALYCVGTDGNMKWHRFIRAAGNPITIGYNGIIYDYAAGDGNTHYIFATDPSNGDILWQTKAYTSYGVTNITIADNGDLIAFVANDSLARFDPANGTIIWKSKVTESSTHRILI
ncbi:MAG: PQQ-like beta-propeller repeat protein, partial [Chlorobi bacterium]|nr:PQQ-like beta-propeller repeat protein [Chlorobiota bacterium]